MADAVDFSDPCQRAAALITAYNNVLTGGQEVEIRTRTDEAEELVKFQPANLDALRSAMQDAIDDCAAANAGRSTSNKRFAITARHKRQPWGPFHHRRYP